MFISGSCTSYSSKHTDDSNVLIAAKDSLNIGQVFIKDSIPINFEVKNIGNRNINIINAGSSCGCSKVHITDSIIRAKSIKKIKVLFFTADTGYFKKTIVIETDSKPNYKTFTFYGYNKKV